MRRPALLTLLTLLCTPVTLCAAEILCDRSGSRTTPSPDGQWIANVQEEVCATATGVAAGITVLLVSARDDALAKRVFVMPVPRSRDDWPRIRWLSVDAMEVQVPNLAEPNPPEPAFEGVRISLAYCNDNPQDRVRLAGYKAAVQQWQKDVTAWVALRKQDPDGAGPRPPRPQEPQLPFGRCTD
jgi:hypothetical protein